MDENLVVWTTDWHALSFDGETPIIGGSGPTKLQNFVTYVNGTLDPFGCIDTGDNKDHYGATGTTDEHDNYITYVGNVLNWMTVNAGDTNALYPNLPGNHDEYYDSGETPPGGNNNFAATYDVKFWGSPYHWTTDWPAARIRFIAIHSYIHHAGTPDVPGAVDAEGLAHVDEDELAWLTNELNTLPDRYQAIVCHHFPIAEVFGNNIRYTGRAYDYATHPLNDVLADHPNQVVCSISGHRHSAFGVAVQDGVTHITGGGVSYYVGNARGCFTPITYDPVNRSLTFDCRYATSPWERISTFTPLTIQLQPHRLFFART